MKNRSRRFVRAPYRKLLILLLHMTITVTYIRISSYIKASVCTYFSIHRKEVYNMYSYCWLLLAILLVILASAASDPCGESTYKFHSTHIGEPIPNFCQDINHWFYNNASYRINFTQSLVDEICGSSICLSSLQLLVLPCATFVSIHIATYILI